MRELQMKSNDAYKKHQEGKKTEVVSEIGMMHIKNTKKGVVSEIGIWSF